MRHSSSGQGSLEYLLLLGAGALVALIVFLLLIFLGPYGGGLFDQNLVEYEKIDLCTASDNAACSLYLNWNEGLLSAPNGFFLENTSPWRTLQMEGIKFNIFCHDGLCMGDQFYAGEGPIITLEFPVDSAGDACDPATQTCVVLPLNMCQPETTDDGSGPVTKLTGPCSMEFDFSDLDALPSPFIEDATFQLTPEEPKKEVVIVSVGNLNNKNLVGVQMSMKVTQLGKDGSFVDEGWDDDAEKLSWYSTSPFLLGSSFQCKNLEYPSASLESYVKFGCIFPPNCSPTACPDPAGPASDLQQACADFGAVEGDFICAVGSGYVQADCVNVSGVDSFFTHTSTDVFTGSKESPFVSMDISPMKGAVFLQNFSPIFNIGVNGFDQLYRDFPCDIDDPAANPACGQALCNGFDNELENLEFYVLNPTSVVSDPLAMCSTMSDASISSGGVLDLGVSPAPGVGPSFGFLDLDQDSEDDIHDYFFLCTQTYPFYTDAFKNNILNSSTSPDIIYVGVRYSPATSVSYELESSSPFSASWGAIGMSAFYYSP